MNLDVFRLNDSCHLEPDDIESFRRCYEEGGRSNLYWIDIAESDAEKVKGGLSFLRLHPIILEGCVDPAVGPRVAPFKESLFIKLPVSADRLEGRHSFLSVICLRDVIVTVHQQPIPVLEHIAEEYVSAAHFRFLSTTAVFFQLFDRLADEGMASVLEASRLIEGLEEQYDQAPESLEVQRVLALKKSMAQLSIVLESQHYCVTTLQALETDVIEFAGLRDYFRDSLANLTYAIQSLGRQQSHAAEMHQHYLLTVQEKTSKRIRLLTILSAIFMPLTLIAGIYGMNFHHMPELATRYGYPSVLLAMASLGGALLWIFHRKGWFK